MRRSILSLLGLFLLVALPASCTAKKEDADPVKEEASVKEQAKQPPLDLENLPARPLVLMKTTMGDLKIELYTDKAPITVKNFLTYVTSGFYDGVLFQRVMPGFMMQGGGYTEAFYKNPNTGRKTPGSPIKNEADNGLKNLKYTLSMARMTAKDSATSQFFINFKHNKPLDHSPGRGPAGFGYAVFGKVIEGMDVVDKIEAVPKTPLPPGMREVALPVEPIIIISAKYVKD